MSEGLCCTLCGQSLLDSERIKYLHESFNCHFACLLTALSTKGDGSPRELIKTLAIDTSSGSHVAEEGASHAWRLAELVTAHGDHYRDDTLKLRGWPGHSWPGCQYPCASPPILHEWPRGILRLRGLCRLDISHHPIAALPEDGWENLIGLRRLGLSNLLIEKVPCEVTKIHTLKEIYLAQNMLSELPDALGRMPDLESLSVTGNQITALPFEFGPPKLQSLTMEGNRIESLPSKLLQRCPNLSELRTQGNDLRLGFTDSQDRDTTSSVEDIEFRSSLCVAYCQGCRLKVLPESFLKSSVDSLQYLLLSDNCLSSIPDIISNHKQLKWLYLYGNNLTQLPPGFLLGCEKLSRCLLEGNPLSGESAMALLRDARRCEDLRRPLNLLGLDAVQIRQACASSQHGVDGSSDRLLDVVLPACVQSGWLVTPGGRWYGKLIPSSQLQRCSGDPILGMREGDEVPNTDAEGRVLMAACAASQGEPEWAGQFAKLHKRRHHTLALRHFKKRKTLHEHASRLCSSEADAEMDGCKLMMTLWNRYNDDLDDQSDLLHEPQHICEEFDVLLLVDPSRRWYCDEHADNSQFRSDLLSVCSRYSRVGIVGSSFGGFCSLSCADLADAVLAFGPQIELEHALYRPGFTLEALRQASHRMRSAVAHRRGSVECHTSMDPHLAQSQLFRQAADVFPVNEPQDSLSGSDCRYSRLVVHPFKGRIARVLERADLLLPILASTLKRLQLEAWEQLNSSTHLKGDTPSIACVNEWPCWQWPYESGGLQLNDSPRILVAMWSAWAMSGDRWFPPTLQVLQAKPDELLMLAQCAPEPGDWLCQKCHCFNQGRAARCRFCNEFCFLEGTNTVTIPGSDNKAFRESDWECTYCERLEYNYNNACSQCERSRTSSQNKMATYCCNRQCSTPKAVVADQVPLRADPTNGRLYCNGCWDFWDHKVLAA